MRSCYFSIERENQTYQLHYTDWGEVDNPEVVVCVHGLTRNGRDFDKLAEALARDYRVICPDVVGRGKSDWLHDPTGYNYDVYTNDLMAIVNSLAPKGCRLNWVGTSMGGLIGLSLAANSAEQTTPFLPLNTLVLNDIGCFISGSALERIAAYVGRKAQFASVEEWELHLRQYSSGFGPLSDEHWRYIAEHSCVKHGEGDYRPAYDPNIAQVFNTAIQDVDLTPLWEKVECPVLLVRGGRSDILNSTTAQQMSQRSNVKFKEFEEVGHAPMLMDDEQISVVKEYLINARRETRNVRRET